MNIDEARADMAVQMLQGAGRFGPVSLLHPSPDVFVLLPMMGGPAVIYARCP